MTSVSKNVYIDKLDDTVNKYDNIYTTIKMKPINAKSNTYINNTDLKFKIGDIFRISKYKKYLCKRLHLNWSEVFMIKTFTNTVPWTYVIRALNGEEIVGRFYKKELQKTYQKEYRVKKVVKRKGNKLHVK